MAAVGVCPVTVPLSEQRLAEHQQTLSAPSDAFPAHVWCEAANDLLMEVLRLRGRLEQADRLLTIAASVARSLQEDKRWRDAPAVQALAAWEKPA